MRSRALVYFGSLLATIALINTPVPRVVVSAVLNPEAGDAVARSLGSITKDLVLVLLISIYFEWVRTREQTSCCAASTASLTDAGGDPHCGGAVHAQLVLDATTPAELVDHGAGPAHSASPDKSSFVSLVLSPKPATTTSRDLRAGTSAEATSTSLPVRADHAARTDAGGGHHVADTRRALSAACPELFEVITLTHVHAVHRGREGVRGAAGVLCGVAEQATRKVDSAGAGERSSQIHLAPGRDQHGDIALFVADISRRTNEYVQRAQPLQWYQDLAEHFIYWVADRPMFISTLTVDVRELVLEQRTGGDGAGLPRRCRVTDARR